MKTITKSKEEKEKTLLVNKSYLIKSKIEQLVEELNDEIINQHENKIYKSISHYLENNNDKINININSKDVFKSQSEALIYTNEKQTVIFNKIREILNTFSTRNFKNIETGENIYISSNDINKDINGIIKNIRQKRQMPNHIVVYNNIDEIINTASLVAKSPDSKRRTEYGEWKYYANKINIDGIPYVIEFDTVLEKQDGKRHFRLKRLEEIEKRTAVAQRPLGTVPVSNHNIS